MHEHTARGLDPDAQLLVGQILLDATHRVRTIAQGHAQFVLGDFHRHGWRARRYTLRVRLGQRRRDFFGRCSRRGSTSCIHAVVFSRCFCN